MNAEPFPWFAEHGSRLESYGYDIIPVTRPCDRWLIAPGKPPVPVKTPGKQPAMLERWQNGCPREQWPGYARCGVGILTRRTPALDIDVMDIELAESIQALADRVLGVVPYRIGLAPKRLMPFRLAGAPFRKVKVEWTLKDQKNAVEQLADGQQFVALGVHPGTGRPYEWHRDPDLSLPHGLLPPVDRARMERFMRALAGALERIGATNIKRSGGKEEPKPVPRPVANGRHPAAAFLAKLPGARTVTSPSDVERIAAALERIGNSDLHYDDWIRIGLAIKAALPGGDGLALWEWWSALSAKNDPKLTANKWKSFDPRNITAATLFWEARR